MVDIYKTSGEKTKIDFYMNANELYFIVKPALMVKICRKLWTIQYTWITLVRIIEHFRQPSNKLNFVIVSVPQKYLAITQSTTQNLTLKNKYHRMNELCSIFNLININFPRLFFRAKRKLSYHSVTHLKHKRHSLNHEVLKFSFWSFQKECKAGWFVCHPEDKDHLVPVKDSKSSFGHSTKYRHCYEIWRVSQTL